MWPLDSKLREDWWVSEDGDPVGEVLEERWTEGRLTAARAASPPETNQTTQLIPVPVLYKHIHSRAFTVGILKCLWLTLCAEVNVFVSFSWNVREFKT